MNNIENTWSGIKSIITTENHASNIPKNLSCNAWTITNKAETS